MRNVERPTWRGGRGQCIRKTSERSSGETQVVGRCSKETLVGGRAVERPGWWAGLGRREMGGTVERPRLIGSAYRRLEDGGQTLERPGWWVEQGSRMTQAGGRNSVHCTL